MMISISIFLASGGACFCFGKEGKRGGREGGLYYMALDVTHLSWAGDEVCINMHRVR